MTPERGTVAEYLAALLSSDRYGPQVVAHRSFAPTDSNLAPAYPPLPEALEQALRSIGIDQLYSHQAHAVESILKKQNVLVSTPTASGKSLIYNLPVFASLMTNPNARALYLFPLKALAQDQVRNIEKLASRLPEYFEQRGRTAAAIYDGDTTSYWRKKIRENLPGIIVTNPDMLHFALLPYHDIWGNLFSNLTHVVIDEVHTYRGVFGSHMAWVVRRLKRICSLYGSNPVFILSSATVGNPEKLGTQLINAPVQVITKSGTPKPPRNIVLLNPLDSAPYAATMLLESALRRELRTIVYTQSRKMTELITMWTGKRIGDLQNKLASYRSGFLPEDRRHIEEGLATGKLLGVISTSALELGIDIGNLDICILVGYPGSMMATWQRAGRVGRKQQESLVVLIGHEDALDQYFMRHPDDFFDREVEGVVFNPDNKSIAQKHLNCAAAESPILIDEPLCSSESERDLLDELTRQGALLCSADGRTWFSARKYPQRAVDLRGSGTRYQIRIKSDRTIIGEIDGIRALKECHQGAIYLHMARSWLVERLDLKGHEVLVTELSPHYFTRPVSNKTTEIIQTYETKTVGSTRVYFGSLRVTETITGYRRYLLGSQKVIGFQPLDLPPQVFETEGLWFEIPPSLHNAIEKNRLHFMGGIHAVEHAMIALIPLLVLCDRNDIGGISHPWHEQLEKPGIFIFDGYSGGVGLTRTGFSRIDQLMKKTLTAVRDCSCDIGCPSCVHSPKCGSGNRPIDKTACIALLEGLLREDMKHPSLKSTPRQFKHVYNISGHVSEKQAPVRLPEKYGVFDVETRRSANEVGGWHRAERMGISIAVLYDNSSGTFLRFEEKDIQRLIEHLYDLDLVIGFNNKRFDNRVLSAYTSQPLSDLPSLDILEEISNQLGYRLSLDRLAEQTLGIKKSGNGLLALKWFSQGRMDLLEKYCRKDVEITRDLFLYGIQHKHLLFQNKAGMTVRLPVIFHKTIEKISTRRKQRR